MKRRELLKAAGVATSAAIFDPDGVQAAGAEHTIRVATLAPKGSSWMRVFDAWSRTVTKRTGGRLRLHFYSGGAAGDERDAVRKMRAGQIDAAAVTTVGLGQIVRASLVLQAPGALYSYEQIEAVRKALSTEFEGQFASAGFQLLGWQDAGQSRLFSNHKLLQPADMRRTRMWSWKDDPTWQSVLAAAGVSGVPLGLPEVYPALRTRRIDAFPGTALAAVAFQWFTRARFVTQEPRGIVIGATVIKRERLDALPTELAEVLIETGRTAHQALARSIRNDDERAFAAITGRGVEAVSVARDEEAWLELLKKARHSLVGKLYTADLLARVEAAAAGARRGS